MKEGCIFIKFHSAKSVHGPSAFENRGLKLGAMDVFIFILNSMHLVSQLCPLE